MHDNKLMQNGMSLFTGGKECDKSPNRDVDTRNTNTLPLTRCSQADPKLSIT